MRILPLAALGLAASVSLPALSQPVPAIQGAPQSLILSRAERTPLEALRAAASGSDRVAQDAALAAARLAARSEDARYAIGHYQLQIARVRGDIQLAGAAVDAIISSGKATRDEYPSLLANQASRAYFANDFQRAERLLGRAIEFAPANAVLIADRAQVKSQIGAAYRRGGRQAEATNEFRESAGLFQRAIELRAAAGQPAPESWHRRALDLAFDNSLGPQTQLFARLLVTYYSSPANWRDALLGWRRFAPADPQLELDVGRLQRAASALAGERDYLDLVGKLSRAGLGGEMKALLDEGVARNMITAADAGPRGLIADATRRAVADRAALGRQRTAALAAATGTEALAAADSHFGFASYAEAAELYRAALQKGGTDVGMTNHRLGAALALAGRRVEAEAALRSVTGTRADLAAFWLAWLSARTAA